VAVVIEELDVQVQPQPAAPQAPSADSQGSTNEVDERALHAALSREAWRHERLAAD
jgi:hypothetical protein